MTVAAFECRLCEGDRHDVVLDLGPMPLANDFVADPSDGTDRLRHPVALVMCRDCRLLQLRDLVPPERLFASYLWTSSSSAAAQRHAAWFASRLAERHPPASHPRLVELASNDGLLLRHLAGQGYAVRGVEPSNLADEASAEGLPTVRAFFEAGVARELAERDGPADVVVARNVLGHVADLRGFLEGVALLLRPGGVFVVESPYGQRLREGLQYDYVFHEHVSYFTVTTLARALTRYGLAPVHLGFVDLNGGSFLCEAWRTDPAAPGPALDAVLELERVCELNEAEGWSWYPAAVDQQKRQLRGLLQWLVRESAAVVGYGAAARTMTMFNACGIGTDLLGAIADGNPRKQGLLCPGSRIPVVSPEQVLARDPDCVLIGPWNFAHEIAGQLRERGYEGRLAVGLPVPRVL